MISKLFGFKGTNMWFKISLVIVAVVVACVSPLVFDASATNSKSAVIFIPGTQGSALQNSKGENVWGGRDAEMKAHFNELEYPAQLRPVSILRSLTVWFVLPYPAYGGISDFLRKMLDQKTKYVEFPYDWRQSNFDSACDLVKLIGNNPELKAAATSGAGLRLVAHSMGGIVARIFLANRVDDPLLNTLPTKCPHNYKVLQFVAIGTPFHGAALSLKYGLSPTSSPTFNSLSSDATSIRRVLFSMPSWYELLPRYQSCCEVAQEKPGGKIALDVTDFNNWVRFGWVPSHLNTPEGRSRIAKYLRNARTIDEIVNKPIENVAVNLLAGSRYNTAMNMLLTEAGQTKWIPSWPESNKGDDTVPVSSVRLPLVSPAIFPVNHMGLLTNLSVQDTLENLLGSDATRGAPVRDADAVASAKSCIECATVYDVQFKLGEIRVESEATTLSVGHTTELPFEVFDEGGKTPFIPPEGIKIVVTDANEYPLSSDQISLLKTTVSADRAGEHVSYVLKMQLLGELPMTAVRVEMQLPAPGNVRPVAWVRNFFVAKP